MGIDNNLGNWVDQSLAGGTIGPTYTSSNASDSNDIYGNSDTVTPAHIKYPLFVCVSNTAVPASEAEYNAFIDGLTNKANIDADNLSVTGKNNILAFAMPLPQTTDNTKVGYYFAWWNDSSATKTLPAGGTWLVWAHHAQTINSFSGYGDTTQYSGLLAGGSTYSTSIIATAGFAIRIA